MRSPVVALSFQTVDGFVDTYMYPSTTSGVLWRPIRGSPGWKIQAGRSRFTFPALTWVSGLCRQAVSTVRW